MYTVSHETNSSFLAPHLFAMHQHADKKVKWWIGFRLVDTCPRNTTVTIIISFTILKTIIRSKYHIKLQNNLSIYATHKLPRSHHKASRSYQFQRITYKNHVRSIRAIDHTQPWLFKFLLTRSSCHVSHTKLIHSHMNGRNE